MNKQLGYIVETKDGKIGRTYLYKGLVKGKVPVYLQIPEDEHVYSSYAILCKQENLKLLGFID